MPTARKTPMAAVPAISFANRLASGGSFTWAMSIDATGTLRSAYRNLLFFWRQRTESPLGLTEK